MLIENGIYRVRLESGDGYLTAMTMQRPLVLFGDEPKFRRAQTVRYFPRAFARFVNQI